MEWLWLEETDSTNRVAKELAQSGAPDTAVAALRQTAGRGRRGRSFFSPEGGIYLSVLLHPQASPGELTRVTPQAAVAVCETLERLCGAAPSIKWVNDILLDGEKLCGILTEAAGDAVIVGVGLNYRTPEGGFPADLGQPVTALYPPEGGPVSRRTLTEAMAEAVQERCSRPLRYDMEAYRRRSLLPGKTVTVHPVGGETYPAQAVEIDDSGRLLVRREDGTVCALDSGEVSVRLNER